jgi:hypothetical protein
MTLNEIFAYVTFVNRQLASDIVPETTKQALCLGIEATLKSLGQYDGYTLTNEDDIERSIRAFHKKNNV